MAFRGKKTTKPVDESVKRVEPFLHFAKHSLAAYPRAGCPFYLPKDQSEEEYLKATNVAKTRSSKNSELCHRLAYGLSMSSGSILSGAEMLNKLLPDKVKKVGMTDFHDMLASGDGPKFIKSCKYLNNEEDSASHDNKKTHEAIESLVNFLDTDSGSKLAVAKRLAMTSARMYLAAMAFLELAALVKHKSTWASKVAPKEKQPAGVKAWLKSPDNVKKLIASSSPAYLPSCFISTMPTIGSTFFLTRSTCLIAYCSV